MTLAALIICIYIYVWNWDLVTLRNRNLMKSILGIAHQWEELHIMLLSGGSIGSVFRSVFI